MSNNVRDAGLLENLTAAVHVRAASYRDKAALLRGLADEEPIARFRNRSLDLSRQFEALARSIDTKRPP